MFTSADLLNLHARGQRSLVKLLEHCRQLTPEELHRELPGFGLATVQLALHHIIEAEMWWVGILQGRCDFSDTAAQYPTIDTLEAYREEVAADTAAYLASATDAELNTAREMQVGDGERRVLIPALVFMRVFTHAYHHQGQAAAMCRLLGHPTPPLDFPLAP